MAEEDGAREEEVDLEVEEDEEDAVDKLFCCIDGHGDIFIRVSFYVSLQTVKCYLFSIL